MPAGDSLLARPVTRLDLGFDGIVQGRHTGALRQSCSRLSNLYPRGTEIRNVRQLSILSAEELEVIAGKMKLARLDPALMGASVVLRGIPDFSHVPPSARLQGGPRA